MDLIPYALSLGLSLAGYAIGHRHGLSVAIAKRNSRSFDDGWNCRGIEDARKAREKLEARRGVGGMFAKPSLPNPKC